MAYSLRKPLESAEFATLEENLRIKYKGRFYSYGGSKNTKDFFCVVWVDEGKPGMIFGHLSGPHGNNATFHVEKGRSFPRYKITPEPGCKATLDVLERQIKHGMKGVYKRSIAETYDGPRDKSDWLGYYLQRIPGVHVSSTADLDLAVAEGVVSILFRETCVTHGLRMDKYPRS